MAIASPVAPEQRHRRYSPCPVCGGFDSLARHKGQRCNGFLSSDGLYAHCSREELAGEIPVDPNGITYGHRLQGTCKCGQSHSGDDAPALRLVRDVALPKTPAKPVHQLPQTCQGLPLTSQDIYHYEDGTEAYRELRYEANGHKTFLEAQPSRAPEGSTGWLLTLDGCRRVLYNLPAILAADPGQPVHITEGTKDAKRLIKRGLLATTNAGGASSWQSVAEASQVLSGRRVVIYEDNDQAGRDRTATIARALEGVAKSIRVVRFPEMAEHSDISGWLDQGHDIAELAAYAEQWIAPTPPTTDIQVDFQPEAAERIRELQAENATLQAALVRTAEKDQRRREILAVPDSQMSHAQKCLALVTLNELEKDRPRDRAGYVPIFRAELARKIGASENTAGTHLKALQSIGLVDINKTYNAERDGWQLAVKLGPAAAKRPAEWMPESGPRHHGGKRAGAGRPGRCSACGSDQLVEHTVIQIVERTIRETLCKACGSITSQNDEREISSRIGESEPDIQVDCLQEERYVANQVDGQVTDTDELGTSLPVQMQNTQVDGVLLPAYPAPDRPCFKCRQTAWIWLGDRYSCGSCLVEEVS